ncbi:hypothetical protein [Ancylobacter terrae]|uniref:hypothetical protein n=1 Tax=Ancylobacter sp. sgz301288 TaxID=3342077 RepID=UPI0038586BD2
MNLLPGLLVILTVPGYLYLQSRAFSLYRGACQAAALIPFALIAAASSYALLAYSLDGANAWPLVFLVTCPLACGYLAVLDIVDWYTA